MRLISSVSRNWVKTGPLWKLKSLVLSEKTLVPRMSAGIISGVPWTRRKSSDRKRARVFTVSVLATPGTPSTSAWPPQSRVSRAWSIISTWPEMTLPSSARPFSKRLMAARASGCGCCRSCSGASSDTRFSVRGYCFGMSHDRGKLCDVSIDALYELQSAARAVLREFGLLRRLKVGGKAGRAVVEALGDGLGDDLRRRLQRFAGD